MSSNIILDKVKKLRELTGVGYKDCKDAINVTDGDIEKSIEFLRKKGIAKANRKMGRVAADGLVCISEKENKFSIIEVNSETDFVAKNNEFIKFVEEISKLALLNSGKMEDILISKMENKKNAGKIGVLVSLKTTKPKNELVELGKQLSMHIAALSPLAIDKDGLDQNILNKEKEIIIEELKNSGKNSKIVDKIAMGKLNKFVNENTLLNQEWIIEPKKRVKEVLKEAAGKDKIEVKKFIRFKVGVGV